MRRATALILLILLSVACEGSPSAPTSETAAADRPVLSALPSRDPITLRHADRQFSDRFWQQFIYNQNDRPTHLSSRTSWVLANPDTMNVYLRTDPWPHAFLARDSWIPWIRQAVGVWVSQLTGETWRGRVETGPERASLSGWITIRFIDPATEYTGNWGGACGRAWVGSQTGEIWLDRTNYRCMRAWWVPHLLAHELGHSYGFFHVADRSAVMSSGGSPNNFNPAEQYHARIAYEAGRGRPYCGWPFGVTCPLPRGAQPTIPGRPIIVVD